MKGGYYKRDMTINFRKISAIGTSILMAGASLGFAAAANYPAPFVSGGAADVAIVYGTGAGVSSLDVLQAGNIQTDLQRYLSGGTGGTDTTTTGEVVSLDTSADRIWLNTSLNAVKSTLTKSDLPTVLEDYTFSGDVTSKITSTLKLIAGGATGGANSGKVVFAKQPTSSDDPVVAISLGTSQTSSPLYNASATMSAINFTNSETEGEEITLFGQDFTIASESDLTKIVLLKEAQKVSLSSDNPSATVELDGETYTIELFSASDDSASITVTNSAGVSQTREVSEAASRRVNGVDIAVTTADETNLKLSATLIVGSQKVTLTSGSVVTLGEDEDPVDGTFVYIVGGTGAATEIAITVFAPDSSNDAILSGTSFVDPVFGSFKVDFAGLNYPLDSTARETISIGASGDDTMTLTMTDDSGNTKTFDFAHNESGALKLGDGSNYSIAVMEQANLSYAEGKARYVVLGNEDYGHLLELYDVFNTTTGSSSITNDRVKFKDVFTGETYETIFSSTEGSGSLDVDGKRYTVTFVGTGENAGVRVKYPTSDSGSGEYVIFPTIDTQNGGTLALYEPQTFALANYDGSNNNISKLYFPDGDGYTSVTLAYAAGNGGHTNWTITGAGSGTLSAGNLTSSVSLTIGELTYHINGTSTQNQSKVSLVDPEGTAELLEPSVVLFEGKDDNTEYHAVVVNLETAPAATSEDELGVDDVLFTQNGEYYHASATRSSDSDFTEDIDWYGTLVVSDSSTSSQKTVEISYPASQVYAQIYVGEDTSTVTGGSAGSGGSSTPLGEVLVMDSEVSSVSSKNLIVVGGSCINSAAATLVGGAYCGDAWMEATEVGAGQFMIKGYASNTLSSKLALLVAGYNAADTVNAATYLRTQTVDTGMHYKGTSSTSASLVTETA